MSITHIVLCRIATGTPEAEIAAIRDELAALQPLVPGMGPLTFGADCSPEGLARGHSHAFVIPFADTAARDTYLSHPAHKCAGQRLVAACEGGVDGLTVLDIA